METKLQQEINEVLKIFPEHWHEDTLLIHKIIIANYNYFMNFLILLLILFCLIIILSSVTYYNHSGVSHSFIEVPNFLFFAS